MNTAVLESPSKNEINAEITLKNRVKNDKTKREDRNGSRIKTTYFDHDTNTRVTVFNSPDRVTNLAFRHPVKTADLVFMIKEARKPEMRFATLGEVFDMLRFRAPLKKDEFIVCLNDNTETGDDIFVFDKNGYTVASACEEWGTNCRFPVAMFY